MENYRNITKIENDVYHCERLIQGEWLEFVASKTDKYFDERDVFFEYILTLSDIADYVNMNLIDNQLENNLIDESTFAGLVANEAETNMKKLYEEKVDYDFKFDVGLIDSILHDEKTTRYNEAKALFQSNITTFQTLTTKQEYLDYYRGQFKIDWSNYSGL